MKIVVVGGVAGGASAAARARRLSEDAEIVMIERGPDPSFANCGLPYYVGGQIEDRNKLLVAPEKQLIERYRLDVRTRQSVERIDRKQKRLTVRRLADNTAYDEPYDKLILAPGAAPVRPPIPGIDLPGIYSLRNLADADRLLERVSESDQRAVVIGAGFIGLEMAENLVHRKVDTTVVEMSDQILPPWDAEMVAPLAEHMENCGVRLVLSDAAESFASEGHRLSVRLKSGRTLQADLVVLSIGVRPENQLAVDAGLEVGPRGGIVVNEFMQTSDQDIYAVGDVVQVQDFITKDPTQIPLAGPANRQGRIAADHIFGRPSRYRGTQGTAIVGLFGQAAAMTGQSEKGLQRAKLAYRKVYIHPSHHAGYYPGAESLTMKLLFEPDNGRILGAQVVGGQGVDKRIDILSVAIQAGMTVFDLEEMELAYAPQFGAAKDPINMAGFVAAGLLRGDHPMTFAEDLLEHLSADAWVLDVRTQEEFAAGHVAGALNIPLEQLRNRAQELPRDRPIVVYCQVGQRGYMAARLLMQQGYDVSNVAGGYRTFIDTQRAKPTPAT